MSEHDLTRERLPWEALERGDLEPLAEFFDPDVRWYDAENPPAGCQSREEVLDFIYQSHSGGIRVELLDLRQFGAQILAVLQRHHPSEPGEPPEPHAEILTFLSGKVSEMSV